MSDVVNVLVAVAVIVVVFRWATSSSETPEDRARARALGFRPKHVTDAMVTTVHTMFPDIPAENIRYDLLGTGDVERTTNKILESGFLIAPPAGYFTYYPREGTPAPGASGASASAAPAAKKAPSLISRFRLEERLAGADAEPAAAPAEPKPTGHGSTWEDSAAKREASLRERKAQMVLAARQRLLAQQQTAGASAAPA